MNIKVKGAEKSDKVLVFLQSKEQQLKDLRSIVRWAKEHKISIGEIAEMLTTYDHYKGACEKKQKEDPAFGDMVSFADYEQFIHDMITNNIEEAE